jgi:phosphoribosylaminoimidazole-succinocarboxamide synthase
MLVKKASPLPIECIVRGYLSGSGWKEYQQKGTVCGINLPDGLVESSRLDEPIFTPSTKAEEGHDINISFEETKKIIGDSQAEKVKDEALAVYRKGREVAEKKGIIIADTKMEMGLFNGKQIVRDYLLTLDWDMKYPGPKLPDGIIEKTAARYREILEILTK